MNEEEMAIFGELVIAKGERSITVLKKAFNTLQTVLFLNAEIPQEVIDDLESIFKTIEDARAGAADAESAVKLLVMMSDTFDTNDQRKALGHRIAEQFEEISDLLVKAEGMVPIVRNKLNNH